ncbi:MAG: acetyl-CoA carboxylase, biotin carboxyl carrier protein [Candidatus Eremiobacteraeota bacterium]|jgi:acetyl-CoA carboxylase biotin carboxyl carrier protein|nr:acetyl-CoA carboxylase, biotin carboxyl carrier protein [Candidatus Eremiobacteraeota bacterium]
MDEEEASRIRALGEIAAEFDLDAIRVRTGETEIEIVRRDPAAYAALPVAYAPATPPPAAGPAPAGAAPAPGRTAGANVRKVTAPVVGVFYRSAAPGSDPFVEVGSRVAAGDTLCILEAMKLMNEINSDHAGVVSNILVENGALVTLGQELFWIEP